MDEEYYPKEKKQRVITRELFDWVESGIIAVVAVVLIFTFVARLAGVSGESMMPTLQDGERLVVTRMGYHPRQGDIVVVARPSGHGEPIIKRIIATGGQMLRIDFEEGVVYVDGIQLDEPYTATPTNRHYGTDFSVPTVIPQGHIFVLGDNRNASLDSRAPEIGMVDNRYIMGNVIYRIDISIFPPRFSITAVEGRA